MTPKELKSKLLFELKKEGIERLHPLHDAMIDECCESALKTIGKTEEIYLQSVKIGFLTANTALKGVLKASLSQADTVTLNYRGQEFVIDENSTIL